MEKRIETKIWLILTNYGRAERYDGEEYKRCREKRMGGSFFARSKKNALAILSEGFPGFDEKKKFDLQSEKQKGTEPRKEKKKKCCRETEENTMKITSPIAENAKGTTTREKKFLLVQGMRSLARGGTSARGGLLEGGHG